MYRTPFNFEEIKSDKVGVIASGPCYHYAKEVFGEDASYLKLGFTFPMPDDKIRAFCQKVEKVYIVEENDPYIEERAVYSSRYRRKSLRFCVCPVHRRNLCEDSLRKV